MPGEPARILRQRHSRDRRRESLAKDQARFWPEPEDIGISLRYVSQHDIATDTLMCRFDVLYGFSTVRQDAFALLWELQQQHNLELNLTAESLEMAPARQALVFHRDAFVLESPRWDNVRIAA